MNYLREINAFRRLMERAPLSHKAQVLWYVLMDFDNRLRWAAEFSIDNDRLMELAGIDSKTTLISIRKELTDAGLLAFTPGKKRAPSIYRMCSIADHEPITLPPEGMEDFLYEVRDDITTYYGYTEALCKELQQTTEAIWREFLPGEKPSEADTREVFNHIFVQYQQDDGTVEMKFPKDRKEMLAHAFEIARKKRAINWSYINGIFRNWADNGIHTTQQIYEHEDERDRRRNCS